MLDPHAVVIPVRGVAHPGAEERTAGIVIQITRRSFAFAACRPRADHMPVNKNSNAFSITLMRGP